MNFHRGFPAPRAPLALALFLFPAIARAHPGHDFGGGLLAGLEHPLTGIDHACAMVAVGIWAAQLGGRALWALPLSFLAAMAAGGAMGMAGVRLPLVEPALLASLLVLGGLIAAAARLPLAASIAVVAAFACFHGHAHGAEMPASGSGLAYVAGFIGATALLHGIGLSFGRMASPPAAQPLRRAAGAAVAAVGVVLSALR